MCDFWSAICATLFLCDMRWCDNFVCDVRYFFMCDAALVAPRSRNRFFFSASVNFFADHIGRHVSKQKEEGEGLASRDGREEASTT